ncbi:hypothetical protein AB6A40_005212 [Gnathostoma spinigerum]|uniref:Rho-GAP domain-containing protein n=1 Tax=Gnathostoma spinigerum TaxID=75299 RepID=A0ABD6EET5_9BILA
MSRRGIQPFCSTSSAPISPRQYFARHSPRLLDGDGEPLPENTIGQHSARMTSDTMSRGVRCIPSKVFPSVQPTDSSQPHHLVGQTNPSYAFSMPRSFTSQTASLQPCLTPLVDYDGATSSAFVSPRTPLVSARTRSLPTTKKMLVSDPLLDSVSRHSYSPISARRARTQYLPLSTPGGISYKSNSLPRRKAVPVASPRTVKWRNDVIGVGDVDSDGAISAPEMAMSPTLASSYIAQKEGRASVPFRGRTVDDIFSAQEYRNWAGSDPIYSACTRRSRWSHVYDQRFPGASVRSSSLPSRKLLSQVAGGAISGQEKRDILDRLHVSPLMNRRVPLRAAGPGFDVDAVNVNSLTGILTVQIIEGRGLRMPEKQKAFTEEMYCVLEVNEIHRARTGVSTAEQRFRWRETFEIDVHHAKHLHFFIYSWHPQFRHKLCHKGSLKLLEAFIVDRLNGDRMFALNLEPKGQLIVRVGFQNMTSAFRRSVNCRYDGVFGVPLQRLLSREGRETPLVLTRLLQEIESRGVEYSGLYILCGSVEKKRVLRCELEMNIQKAQLGVGAVPDTNVLACTVKDFLRELPEPLIPTAIYCMLVEAFSVAMPNDPQGNQQLLLRVIDCLPPANKNTLIQIMDHLKSILNTESHNGMAANRLTTIFGCLLFCSCDPPQEAASGSYPPKETVNPLDTDQAAHTLSLLINIWPSRVSGSESSSDSTDPTLAPNTIPESQC